MKITLVLDPQLTATWRVPEMAPSSVVEIHLLPFIKQVIKALYWQNIKSKTINTWQYMIQPIILLCSALIVRQEGWCQCFQSKTLERGDAPISWTCVNLVFMPSQLRPRWLSLFVPLWQVLTWGLSGVATFSQIGKLVISMVTYACIIYFHTYNFKNWNGTSVWYICVIHCDNDNTCIVII